MTDQLALDVAPPRVYECCGCPCGELPPALTGTDEDRARAREMAKVPWPHADDCPHPSVGMWVDRATGWPIRRLHCVQADGTCPYGGTFPQRPGLADPYGGLCCLAIAHAEENMIRVDGGAECPTCHRPYRDHPWDEENLFDGAPYLRIGCDGRGLKL